MTLPARFHLLHPLPSRVPDELFQTLLQTPALRIERIVSSGQCSPPDFWYDQPESEWVLLLQGRARLQFETGMVDLAAGDALDIPAHCRHRVDWTAPDETTVWLAVFYPGPGTPGLQV